MSLRTDVFCFRFALCLLVLILIFPSHGLGDRMEEYLDRGVHAQYNGSSVYVSWRLLKDDETNIKFNVYRRVGAGDPVLLNGTPISDTTDFVDVGAPQNEDVYYSVAAVIGGEEMELSEESVVDTSVAKNYFSFDANGTVGKIGIGDLDGDGAYDFVIKTPSGTIDPATVNWHASGSTYKLVAFKSDGTYMWTFDLGWNIEQGVWYSPYMVYDLDGDGKAEVIAKTCNDETDYRDDAGRVQTGPEHLSVINGETAQIIDYVDWPDRTGFSSYNYFSRNQVGLAFLDGETPAIIAARGTYDLMKATAYAFENGQLSVIWAWRSDQEQAPGQWDEQGAHSMHCADVDGDGKDEVILGSCVLDDTGDGLWTNGFDHCDHCYVGDLDPEHEGLEIYYGYEDGRSTGEGISMWDAATGTMLWEVGVETHHIHREGMVADIDPNHRGMECYSGEKDYDLRWLHAADGAELNLSTFYDRDLRYAAVYWDADPQREVIVQQSIFDYAQQPISITYEEDFTVWWDDWQLVSDDGNAHLDSSAVNCVYYVADDTWQEMSITWNTKPATSGAVLDKHAIEPAGQWVEFDVTSQAQSECQGDDILSLVLTSLTSNTAFYDSREGTDSPELVVVTNLGTTVLYPEADALVRGGDYANVNYGDLDTLGAKESSASTDRKSYLRFNLSSISGTISSAKLYLYTNGGTPSGSAVVKQSTSANWTLHTVDNITVVPGATYFVTAMVYCQESDPITFEVATVDEGEIVDYDILDIPQEISGAQTWTRLASTFTVPVGISDIKLAFVGNQTDRLEISQITLLADPNPDRYKGVSIQGDDIAWADVYGDWREEIITCVGTEVRIYSTDIPATDRRVSLMQDPLYRSDVAHVAMGYPQIPTSSYCLSEQATEPPQSQYVLTPEADAYVRGGIYSGDNFGGEDLLRAKNGSSDVDRRIYLRFDLSEVSGTIVDAKLRLYVQSNSGSPENTLHPVADDSWGEMTVTWSNGPSYGSEIDALTVPGAGEWVEFDVLDQVITEYQGDGKISLYINSSSSDLVSYSSREGSNPPQLVITCQT